MNYVDLPDLQRLMRGFALRKDAARAISQVEMLTASGADSSSLSQTLGDFFIAAANAAYAAGSTPQQSP